MNPTQPELTKVFAPATTGNAAVGFDILGFALEGIGDTVTARKINTPEVVIHQINGCVTDLPTDPAQNTATAGLLQLIKDKHLAFGFEITIDKGIPLGSGLGGSAASAVAAIVAASALLDSPLTLTERFHYAMIGEKIASGAAHGDNIAPCLYGGVTLVSSLDPIRIVRIPLPPSIGCIVVTPEMQINTRDARQVIRENIPLSIVVDQSAYLASFIAACFRDDMDLLLHSIQDVMIEPQRAALIPGFNHVKQAALDAGAFACSISGAGPTVFALYHYIHKGEPIKNAMVQAFESAGLKAVGRLSPINSIGAHIIS